MRLDIENMTVAAVNHLPKPDTSPRDLKTPVLSPPRGEETPRSLSGLSRTGVSQGLPVRYWQGAQLSTLYQIERLGIPKGPEAPTSASGDER